MGADIGESPEVWAAWDFAPLGRHCLAIALSFSARKASPRDGFAHPIRAAQCMQFVDH